MKNPKATEARNKKNDYFSSNHIINQLINLIQTNYITVTNLAIYNLYKNLNERYGINIPK